MVDIIRETVSGARIRLIKGNFNLDLTYITQRIIAMSFPSSGFESIYRNPIEEVVNYLNQNHFDHYLILNVSNRSYDYTKFGVNKVKDYGFKNHYPPTLKLLFNACEEMYQFLNKDSQNVVIVHCEAGKGRTGTVISCLLLYCGLCLNSIVASKYYGFMRFIDLTGVTNPSQLRYIDYFEMTYKQHVLKSSPVFLNSFKIRYPPCDKDSILVKIENTSSNEIIFDSEKNTKVFKFIPKPNQYKIKFIENILLDGDILIKVESINKIFKNTSLFRFSFNTAFHRNENSLVFNKKSVDPDSVAKNKSFPDKFFSKIKFASKCPNNCKAYESKLCEECTKLCQLSNLQWKEITEILTNHIYYEQNYHFNKKENKLLMFKIQNNENLFGEYFPEEKKFKINTEQREAEIGSKNDEHKKLSERLTIKNRLSPHFHKKTNLRRYRLLKFDENENEKSGILDFKANFDFILSNYFPENVMLLSQTES